MRGDKPPVIRITLPLRGGMSVCGLNETGRLSRP